MHKATRQPVIFFVTGLDNLTSWFKVARIFELVKSEPNYESRNYPTTVIWILALGLFCNDLNAQRNGGPAPRPSGGLSSVTGGIVGQNEHLSRNHRSLRFSSEIGAMQVKQSCPQPR